MAYRFTNLVRTAHITREIENEKHFYFLVAYNQYKNRSVNRSFE